MKLLTIATHESGYLKILKKSCKKNKIKLIVLGYGEHYYSHHFKDDKIIEFTNNCNENEIIIFVDGFDSILTNSFSIKKIQEEFIKSKKNLIVSTENIYDLNNNNNDNNLYLSLKNKIHQEIYFASFVETFGVYINTGMYIGYAGYINEFLKLTKRYINENNIRSNQRLWQDTIINNPNILSFDNECFYFRNLSNEYQIDNMITKKYNEPNIISCPSVQLNSDSFEKYLKIQGYNINHIKNKYDLRLFLRKIFFYQERRVFLNKLIKIFKKIKIFLNVIISFLRKTFIKNK